MPTFDSRTLAETITRDLLSSPVVEQLLSALAPNDLNARIAAKARKLGVSVPSPTRPPTTPTKTLSAATVAHKTVSLTSPPQHPAPRRPSGIRPDAPVPPTSLGGTPSPERLAWLFAQTALGRHLARRMGGNR